MKSIPKLVPSSAGILGQVAKKVST